MNIVKQKFIIFFFFATLSMWIATEIHAQWVDANGPYEGPYDGFCNAFTTIGPNIFAATDSGIYRSTDTGKNWIKYGLKDSSVKKITFMGQILFALTENKNAFRSIDSGATWQPTQLFASASGGKFLFAIGNEGRVHRSADSGLTWSAISLSPIHVLAAANNIVYAGGDNDLCIRSTDFGNTWNVIKSIGGHGFVHVIKTTGNIVCVGTAYDAPQSQDPGGNIYISRDSGITWSSSSPFYTVWDYAIDFFILPTSIILGSSSGIFRVTNDTVWTEIDRGLPAEYSYGNFSLRAMTRVGSTSLIAMSGYAGVDLSVIGYGVFSLPDQDSIWSELAPHTEDIPADDRIIEALAIQGSSLVAISDSGTIYRSFDHGDHWKYLASLPISADTNYTCLLSYDGKLFAGTDSGIAVSTDLGTTWKTIPIYGSSIMSIIIDGSRMIAGGQGVYISVDKGGSWTALLGRPPGDVRSITVLGKSIFVTTEFGLFESIDNGTHWNQIQNQQFREIHSVFASGQNLLVASDQIYLSTDAGMTWSAPEMEVSNGARDVTMFLRFSNITIAGLYYYGIDISFDNGLTWRNDSTSYAWVSSVAVDSSYFFIGTVLNGVSDASTGVFRRHLSDFARSSVGKSLQEYDISLFPNPASTLLTIRNAPENLASITIMSVLGQSVLELASPHAPDFTIDISKLPSGMYYARFLTGSSVEVKKIIKE